MATKTAKRKWKRSSPELMEKFQTTLAEFDQVEMRKMFGYPCSFFNGYLFTGLHEENWILRLAPEDLEEIKQEFKAQPFTPMQGRPMREYVKLPTELLNNGDFLGDWLARSLNYISSLPPKEKKSKS